jgi:electron transport complex protein RnfE
MSTPSSSLRAVLAEGFWSNNTALVGLLGLCPLLAITTSIVNGLALGLATLGVWIITSTAVSLLRNALSPAIRIPFAVLVAATLVTCIDLIAHAALDELHTELGIFIPLIVTNCAIVVHAETVATRRSVGVAFASAAASGLGFLAVLTTLGALRELVGHGTLLAGLPMLAGEAAASVRLALPVDGVLVAVLPPGAFFGLAALLAARNLIAGDRPAPAASPAQGAAERAR